MKPLLIIFCLALSLQSCMDCNSEQGQTPPLNSSYLDSLYKYALLDAAVIEEDENYQLRTISKSNKDLVFRKMGDKEYIKVVTWLPSHITKIYKNAKENYDGKLVPKSGITLWFTLFPYFQNYCQAQSFRNNDALLLRMKQKLGLPYGRTYQWIAELWVPVEAIKRPCPDPSTDNERCFTQPDIPLDVKYHKWYFEQRALASVEVEEPFPFTGLGYTYDWGLKAPEFGFTEFVFQGDGEEEVFVDGLYRFEEYCEGN